MRQRVVTGRAYIFDPVPMDAIDPKTRGISPGDLVRVVNLPGCPPANGMGHCHIERADTGEFAGLVCTNSLTPLKAPDSIKAQILAAIDPIDSPRCDDPGAHRPGCECDGGEPLL